uniref:Uncharacterized protein n=1 Tax=Solanum lycopersicum TaxID=4081 RepID=A0A3Q7H190_SOLLC
MYGCDAKPNTTNEILVHVGPAKLGPTQSSSRNNTLYIIPLCLYLSLSFALRTPGAATREHKAQDLSSEPYLTALLPPYCGV